MTNPRNLTEALIKGIDFGFYSKLLAILPFFLGVFRVFIHPEGYSIGETNLTVGIMLITTLLLLILGLVLDLYRNILNSGSMGGL